MAQTCQASRLVERTPRARDRVAALSREKGHKRSKREDKPSACHLQQPEYRRAVELLLDIAGPASEHIRMNEREGKKYYTNLEPLTLRHIAAHLEGRRTYGALIRYPDGTTRASIYDADTPESVAIVEEAARRLLAAGYRPLIELSPVRKAHLVIIYTENA